MICTNMCECQVIHSVCESHRFIATLYLIGIYIALKSLIPRSHQRDQPTPDRLETEQNNYITQSGENALSLESELSRFGDVTEVQLLHSFSFYFL